MLKIVYFTESDTDVTNEEKVEILKTTPQRKRILKVKKIAVTEKSNEGFFIYHYETILVEEVLWIVQ